MLQVFFGSTINHSLILAQGVEVGSIDAKKIDIILSYVSDLAPPIVGGQSSQNTKYLTEGDFFLSKPILPNTIISTLPREKITTYTVAEGDTIYTISYRFEITIDTLRWVNNITDTNAIKPGQEMIIPPVNGLVYTVKEGDTLEGIAKDFSVSADTIKSQNKIAGNLPIGEMITLPGARKTTAQTFLPVTGPGMTAYSGSVVMGSGNFVWPLTSRTHFVTQYFGWVTKTYKHTGVDLDFRNGLDILASDQGTVVSVGYGWGGGYGNHIIIDHGNGYQTLYGHLSSVLVKPGDNVTSGQKIGIMGSTGFSTGTHLHFEVRLNGVAQNPFDYVK